MQEANARKEIVVKRISASQFEVCEETAVPVPRQSVIRRAPPAAGAPAAKRRRKDPGETAAAATGVILIKDAITYRIVDILMWKLAGEVRLRGLGYPSASTAQLLWRLVPKHPGDRHSQDHDCGGDLGCFSSHVFRLLETAAPGLWRRPGRAKLSAEELLRRIYREDLIPYLRSLDLRNNPGVLQCHSDIVLLEKWEQQRFTAVTWSGQKHLSRVPVNWPECPQCSNRHF